MARKKVRRIEIKKGIQEKGGKERRKKEKQ